VFVVNGFVTARLTTLSIASSKATEKNAPAAESVSDEVLLGQLAIGDAEALGLLFHRYETLVRGVAIRILKDCTETEDLVQDLFLFLRRKANLFDRTKSSARSWIIQMAYHRAIDRRRYLTSRHFYSSSEITENQLLVDTPTAEADYSAEAVFGRNGLSQVLKSLSEDQRETLRLHFFEGYTLAEISQKFGRPLGSVRHHYYRGLDKLRKQMFRNTVAVGQRHGK
jgi:RNA polymerase sigma-70 factor, ECF subfamily